MSLPSVFDPEAVRLVSILIRQQLAHERFDELTADQRQTIVEHGVEKMMAAGAYVRDGILLVPAGTKASDL